MLSNNELSLEERADLNPSEKKMWRSLIRVTEINFEKKRIGLILPSWNSQKPLYFELDQLPSEIRKKIYVGYRFHAPANIGASGIDDIYIDVSSWD